jgi:hypothetical protein
VGLLLLEKDIRSDMQRKQCTSYLIPFSDPVCALFLLCCCSPSHAFIPQADFSFNMLWCYEEEFLAVSHTGGQAVPLYLP